jgi:hypothetical protein
MQAVSEKKRLFLFPKTSPFLFIFLQKTAKQNYFLPHRSIEFVAFK